MRPSLSFVALQLYFYGERGCASYSQATSEERSCNKRQNDGLAECSASDQFSFIQGCAGSSISDYTIGMHLRSVECDDGTLESARDGLTQ